MKTLSLCLALFCSVPFSTQAAQELTGRVVKVGDGGSCWLRTPQGGRLVKVNLALIDAPGARESFGKQAKSALTDLVLNREVHVDVLEKNSDETIVGMVWVKEVNINATLLHQGWARVVGQGAKDWVMVALEENAKAGHRGRWASTFQASGPLARRPASVMANPRTTMRNARLPG